MVLLEDVFSTVSWQITVLRCLLADLGVVFEIPKSLIEVNNFVVCEKSRMCAHG